jgi:hypothetical protein
MFLRPLIDLSEFVAQRAGTDSVEVYYRCTFSERKVKKVADKGRGVRAFTRIRWQRAGMEWSVGLGGFLPSLPAMESLIELASPGKMEIPIPVGQFEKQFSVSPSHDKDCNVTGWFRDYLVTASGVRLSAEGEFSLFEDEYGLWNKKPKWTGLQENEEHLVLSPRVALVLLQAGLLKGIACRKRCRGFLHNVFDQVGNKKMNWCRTPDNLDVLAGAVGLSVPEAAGNGGQICNRAVIDTRGGAHLFCGNTKIGILTQSVIKSMKRISDEYRLYRHRSMFQLPWIELKGGAEWESH